METNLLRRIADYIESYVAFDDPRMGLVLATWVVATYFFPVFDAFPYLSITSNTKRSGKSRCAEILSFLVKKPLSFAACTAATLFRSIGDENDPSTVFFDEAEELSSEAASTMRAVLNVGYRRGQTVPRVTQGSDSVVNYHTYCPKVFILIGDTFDTLRDRSIIIAMRRAVPRVRFLYGQAKMEAEALKAEIKKIASWREDKPGKRTESLYEFVRTRYETTHCDWFPSDRDAEIWSPLLATAKIVGTDADYGLVVAASADLAAVKTAPARRHNTLRMEDEAAEDGEYAAMLLKHVRVIFTDKLYSDKRGKFPTKFSVDQMIHSLRCQPEWPWRTYRGEGLTPLVFWQLLSRYRLRSKSIRQGRKILRGIYRKDVEKIRNEGEKAATVLHS